MLGVDRSTVSSLVENGKLGSKKVGSSPRIFLSDLESYLGEDRARSLVRDLSTSGACGDRPNEQAQKRASKLEKVAKVYAEISEDQVIVLSDLPKEDLQIMREKPEGIFCNAGLGEIALPWFDGQGVKGCQWTLAKHRRPLSIRRRAPVAEQLRSITA